jgi:hypothetical protein
MVEATFPESDAPAFARHKRGDVIRFSGKIKVIRIMGTAASGFAQLYVESSGCEMLSK